MTRTWLLALALSSAAPLWADTVVLTGARILDPGVYDGEAALLIEDGKVKAVLEGKEPKLPYDARVIDVRGMTLFPGMVLGRTSSGLDRANESLPTTPFLDAFDAIDPSSVRFESFLREGVTTVNVMQGNDTAIGGMGRAVQPLGLTVEEMTVRAGTGLILSVSDRPGWDRVRQRAQLRESFAQLQDELDKAAEKRYAREQQKDGKQVEVPPAKARELGRALLRPEDVDEKQRNLYLLVQGQLDAFVYCERAQDVPFALAMADELGFLPRTTLVLGGDCYKALELIKTVGRPVLLMPDLLYRETDPLTGEEHETFVPRVYADADVPFGLMVDRDSSFGERYLWYQAARCVREGVDREQALKAITHVPAQILGLEGQVGTLQPGAAANVLVLSGDPLDAGTHVEQVLLGGEVVYERSKDVRLERLLSGSEGSGPMSEHKPHEGEEELQPNDADKDPGDPNQQTPGEQERGADEKRPGPEQPQDGPHDDKAPGEHEHEQHGGEK
ncbi:MAG: amidohydrolase family protein [Planctomycetes bacterium]|nr:amidohydrolase family protein [Planctomycetota bacterium]